MAREQLGICTEANLHSDFLLFNAMEGSENILRHKLARLPQLIDRLAGHFSEAMLTSVVAVGANYWDSLYPDARPLGLGPFPDIRADAIDLAAMPIDLLIQLRSDRRDVNFIACQQVQQLLGGYAELQDHIQGFRYLDGRSLTGFIDMPCNPRGKAKRDAALINHKYQPVFAAGSYLYLQCINIQLNAWQKLSLDEQEDIMGMHKVSGLPVAADRFLPDSHLAVLQPVAGGTPDTLQQHMPFTRGKLHGSMQLTYSADASALKRLLQRRLGQTPDSVGYDQLLNYNTIEFSAAFFAPSLSFLELAVQPLSGQLTFE